MAIWPVAASYWSKARFPFKRNRLHCVNENRKKRKRLCWQAANHGCHCFDTAFLLAGATQRTRMRLTQAIAFEWKPGFSGRVGRGGVFSLAASVALYSDSRCYSWHRVNIALRGIQRYDIVHVFK